MNRNARTRLPILTITLLMIGSLYHAPAQEVRWLRVGQLQTFINELGAEYETEGTTWNTNFLSWPAQYSIDQNMLRSKGLWIGCRNFDDPVERKVKSVKVTGMGPRDIGNPERPNMIFEQEIKLIGKYPLPGVTVDDQSAAAIRATDVLDEVDPSLPCDRMVLVRFNTSMGISVTKKVMAFSSSEHGNYFIHDYVFKNTGIYSRAGDVKSQTLDSVWFYFVYRYAFAGVTSGAFGSTWGAFESGWGPSTLNHAFGQDPASADFNNPSSPMYRLRGFYSYYGPYNGSPRPAAYEDDWGCPDLRGEAGGSGGTLGSAKYSGCATLHADSDPQNHTDDLNQPRTTWYIAADLPEMSSNVSQYNEIFMSDRWRTMTEGKPTVQHDDVVGNNYNQNYSDTRRYAGGGTAQGQGYGPYRMAPGDSIHIVFAEGASGITWEKGREVGANWIQWRNGTAQPTLVLPNGSTTTDFNLYKRRWVETGKDSILQTYRNAYNNYQSGYALPQAPDPPSRFTVTSGGDRIQLSWASNATSHPHFDGYVIYRSQGTVQDFRTVYQKVFECSRANVVHTFDDTSAGRGLDYYYYIQSKDDGTQVPGKVVTSSMFWTLTSIPATLGRPAGAALEQVRVVPNPYDIRSRIFQFSDPGTSVDHERIAFFGLPPACRLRIYTERGDLIWEKEHTRPTGDELWNSTTSSGQIIASGVYILYVEVTQDTYDTWVQKDQRVLYKKGDHVIRKFVVIR